MKNIFTSCFSLLASKKGQGLLEMTVALGVVMTGLVGVLTLAVVSLSGGRESENGIVASNLAREGIEVVRNIRDSNWLAGRSWEAGIFDGAAIAIFDSGENTWDLDFTPEDIDSEATLLYRQNGVYSHNPAGQLTIFRRLIAIASSADHKQVNVLVQWTEKNKIHEVNIEDYLYDWK